MLFGDKHMNARLSVLETKFDKFQLDIKEHEKHEEDALRSIGDSVSELKKSFHDSYKDNWSHVEKIGIDNMNRMEKRQDDLLTRIDKEFMTNAKFNNEMAGERKETEAQIFKASKEAQGRVTMIFTTIAAIVMTLGWAISNDFIKFSDGTHEIITHEIPI